MKMRMRSSTVERRISGELRGAEVGEGGRKWAEEIYQVVDTGDTVDTVFEN